MFISENLQDIAKVEASIGKFSKQMDVCRMDKERWMCRFKASRAQLAEIQNEIAALVSCTPFFCLLMKPNFRSPLKTNHSFRFSYL